MNYVYILLLIRVHDENNFSEPRPYFLIKVGKVFITIEMPTKPNHVIFGRIKFKIKIQVDSNTFRLLTNKREETHESEQILRVHDDLQD